MPAPDSLVDFLVEISQRISGNLVSRPYIGFAPSLTLLNLYYLIWYSATVSHFFNYAVAVATSPIQSGPLLNIGTMFGFNTNLPMSLFRSASPLCLLSSVAFTTAAYGMLLIVRKRRSIVSFVYLLLFLGELQVVAWVSQGIVFDFGALVLSLLPSFCLLFYLRERDRIVSVLDHVSHRLMKVLGAFTLLLSVCVLDYLTASSTNLIPIIALQLLSLAILVSNAVLVLFIGALLRHPISDRASFSSLYILMTFALLFASALSLFALETRFPLLVLTVLELFLALIVLALRNDVRVQSIEFCRVFSNATVYLSSIVFLIATVSLYHFLSSPILDIPWFDTWYFWGNAFYSAITGNIYQRYSVMFPGSVGLFNSALLSQVFTAFPVRDVTLSFIRSFPLLITLAQLGGLIVLISVYARTHGIQATFFSYVLGVIVFVSSAWGLFYLFVYTREAIGILVFEALLISLVSEDRFTVIDAILAGTLIFVSEIEFLLAFLALLVFMFLRRPESKHESVRIALPLYCVIILTGVSWKVWGLTTVLSGGAIEPFNGLQSIAVNSASQQGVKSIFQSIFSINSLLPAMQNFLSIWGYAIISSGGVLVFACVLLAFRHRDRIPRIIWSYYIGLVVSYFVMGIWWETSLALDLDRRLVPQLSLLAAFVTATFFLEWHRGPKFRTAMKLGAVILLALQMGYLVQSTQNLDYQSQTSVAVILENIGTQVSISTSIVVDEPLLRQAEGLLAPHYVIRGSTFSHVLSDPSNSSQVDLLSKYLNQTKVIVLIVDSPYSTLSNWLGPLQHDPRFSVISKGDFLILDQYPPKNETIYILRSQS